MGGFNSPSVRHGSTGGRVRVRSSSFSNSGRCGDAIGGVGTGMTCQWINGVSVRIGISGCVERGGGDSG